MKENEMNNELLITAHGLIETFVNRPDCFAVQLETGQYFYSKNQLTQNHVVAHLKGEMTLAVYLLGLDNTTKFTVIDADDDEGLNKLIKVQEALEFPSYLESSRRGGHLWFFFEEPIEGKLAKNFGLEIAKRFLIEAEVFPKQAQSEGPGSCIRLPFGVHRKTGERYPFVGLGNWRKQIDELMHPKPVPLDDVMKYQYQEPEKKKTVVFSADSLVSGDLLLWEKVKTQITVKEMVEKYVDLSAKGIGKCPFHDDLHASLSVNEKENYWNCFAGCGGGSVIDFWMKLNNLDFQDAVKDLSEKLGVK